MDTGVMEVVDEKKDDIVKPEYIDISDTAIPEYLEIVKDEYKIERDKKQSFENRAGLIITILAAICIFLFEKIQLYEIVGLMAAPITFILLTKIIAGIAVYIGFVITIFMVYKTISVKKHNNFEVKQIDEELLRQNKLEAVCRLIFTYRDIIVQHREENENRASSFKKSLQSIVVTILCTIIYISI